MATEEPENDCVRFWTGAQELEKTFAYLRIDDLTATKAHRIRELVFEQMEDGETPSRMAFLYCLAAIGHISCACHGELTVRQVAQVFVAVAANFRFYEVGLKEDNNGEA
ncbi:MAG: hypothetical protein K0U84_15165 [Actinomycetia bacterium]|nr:hypothetical protein [Actinomycetes bacterium]